MSDARAAGAAAGVKGPRRRRPDGAVLTADGQPGSHLEHLICRDDVVMAAPCEAQHPQVSAARYADLQPAWQSKYNEAHHATPFASHPVGKTVGWVRSCRPFGMSSTLRPNPSLNPSLRECCCDSHHMYWH